MAGFEELNLFAILVAAIAGMALGALWYSPLLFGNAWMRELGKTEAELGAPTPAMVGSMITCLVSAAAVEWLIVSLGTPSLALGAAVGIVTGLGIVAMTMLSDGLFSGWSWKLYFIQAGYRVLYLLMMGVICGAWMR